MLDHTGVVVTDLAKARRFYDAIANRSLLPRRRRGASIQRIGRNDRAASGRLLRPRFKHLRTARDPRRRAL
jgi:hypothetical protein